MKIAIIGASSFIGFRLFSHLKQYYEVKGTYFQHKKAQEMIYLDISQKNNVQTFIEQYKPDTILWVAGDKNLALTEKDLSYARAINTSPIIYLLESIKRLKSYYPKIIFFSTDYVFDGIKGNYRHNDIPNPQTNYGKSNEEAERLLQNQYPHSLIIRTSAVMGKGGTFFDFLLSSICSKDTLELYDDTIFTPTPISLLIEHTSALLHTSYCGILHICGSSAYTRYGFGIMIREILAKKEIKLATLVPVHSTQNNQRLFFANLSLICSLPFDNYEREIFI